MKRCPKCQQDYPATAEWFFRSKRRKDGWNTWCKKCLRVAIKRCYRSKNPEIKRAPIIRPALEHGEKYCLRCHQIFPASSDYFTTDVRKPDGLYSYCNQCRLKPPQPVLLEKACTGCGVSFPLTSDFWYHNRTSFSPYCKECYGILSHVRRAAGRRVEYVYRITDWKACLFYWDYACAVCGRSWGLWHTLARDHWIPISDASGPGTVPWNIVPLCHGANGCNTSKNDREALPWLLSRFPRRKALAIYRKVHAYLDAMKRKAVSV